MMPAKGTPEYELFIAAIEVAADAPLTRHANTARAGIYWPRIHRLRAALDELGIDWRAVKAWRAVIADTEGTF